MTPLSASAISEMFQVLRSVTPEEAHELVDVLERRMLLDEMALAKIHAEEDVFSRKVPDVPALRLVGRDAS